jgi:uncharacterized protein YkwD
MRKVLTAAGAVLLALVLVACTPEEASHGQAVNDFRTANGVPILNWEEQVYPAARAWSQHMADAGALSHPSNLAADFNVPAGWHKLGQNVAVAPTLESAMTALENSAPHRANLLDPAFTRIAIGIIQQGGRYWVTEDFIG